MSRYATAARGIADELKATLSSAEIDALRDHLRGAGLARWLLWEREHQDHIEAYLEATPAQRARKKSWAEPETRRLLTYGAICCALRGAAILDVLSDPMLQPGLAYRQIAAAAGRAWQMLQDDPVDDWPFPGSHPFSDES